MVSVSSLRSLNGERRGKDIFISYGREEGVKDFVRQLKSDLEAANLSVWLDTEIPAGSEWPREIGLALQDCKALIAVVTKKYVCSRYCKCELYVACDKHKDIFPLIYEDGWTECEEGVGVSYMISAYNWTFFRPRIDDYSASLQKLIHGLKGTQSPEMSSPSPGTSYHRVASDAPTSPVSDTPDTPTLAAPLPRGLSTKPKLSELRSLKCRDGTKIEIITSIAPTWKDFGILLEFDDDGRKLDLIEANQRVNGPAACCTEMFQTWLKGAGRQPASWDIVIELLEDCEQEYLAQQVKAAL